MELRVEPAIEFQSLQWWAAKMIADGLADVEIERRLSLDSRQLDVWRCLVTFERLIEELRGRG